MLLVIGGCSPSRNETIISLSDKYQERIETLVEGNSQALLKGVRLDTLFQFRDLNSQLKILYPNSKAYFVNVDHIVFFLERKENLLTSKSLFFSYQLGDSGICYDLEIISRFVDFDVSRLKFKLKRVDNLHYYLEMVDNSSNGL